MPCSEPAPPDTPPRYAFRSRANSRVTMLGGFGLGVPRVLTTVVAPRVPSVVTAAGYGAAVLLTTATRLPLSAVGESETSLPDIASNAVAASATVFAIGPGES
jgi:hypothetical protein